MTAIDQSLLPPGMHQEEEEEEETGMGRLVGVGEESSSIPYEDPGTPLQEEAQQQGGGELFADGEEESDEDDVQITIGPIGDVNVAFRAATGAAKATAAGAAAPAGKLDVDATSEVSGTPIYDLDLANMTDKPWRKPGADITDYFNYGFTEDTWNVYCERQRKLRAEFGAGNANKILFSNLTLTGSTDRKFEPPKMITNLAERFGNRRPEPIAVPVQQPIMRTVLTKQVPAAQPPGGLPQISAVPAVAPPSGGAQMQVLPTVNLAKQMQQQHTTVTVSVADPVVPAVPTSIPVLTSVASVSESPFSGSASDSPGPEPVQVLTTTPAVPTPTVQPILQQVTQSISSVGSSSAQNEMSEGPPGVEGEPEPPGGATPPPGADAPPSAIPTINTSVPPPRFGTNTSVPPPQRFSVPPPGYQGPPGTGSRLPMTNFPPPGFAGNPPPPGVPIGQRAYGFAPMARAPPMIRGGPPRMMRHPGDNSVQQGSSNERERSPASYSDKSSDIDDRDYQERHRTIRPKREFPPRASHRRESSPTRERRSGHRESGRYHGTSRRSRSRSPTSSRTRSRRAPSEEKKKKKTSAKVKEEPPDEEPDEAKEKKKKRKRKEDDKEEKSKEDEGTPKKSKRSKKTTD